LVADNGRSKASSVARSAVKGQQMLEAVASGMTVTAAAKHVGVSRKHGSELYHRELQVAMEANAELRQHLLAQDLETLRLLILAHMGPATGSEFIVVEDEVQGEGQTVLARCVPNPSSAKIVLSALDRRAKLLGLDAAVRIEISQSRIQEVVDAIVALTDGATSAQELAEVLQIDSAPSRRSGA